MSTALASKDAMSDREPEPPGPQEGPGVHDDDDRSSTLSW